MSLLQTCICCHLQKVKYVIPVLCSGTEQHNESIVLCSAGYAINTAGNITFAVSMLNKLYIFDRRLGSLCKRKIFNASVDLKCLQKGCYESF